MHQTLKKHNSGAQQNLLQIHLQFSQRPKFFVTWHHKDSLSPSSSVELLGKKQPVLHVKTAAVNTTNYCEANQVNCKETRRVRASLEKQA